jgi:hypothetical protein
MVDVVVWAEYFVWGLMGAVAHLAVMKFLWEEKTYIVREIVLSIVLSFVISQGNLPNKFATFGLSFLGVDAIEAFLRRLAGRIGGN